MRPLQLAASIQQRTRSHDEVFEPQFSHGVREAGDLDNRRAAGARRAAYAPRAVATAAAAARGGVEVAGEDAGIGGRGHEHDAQVGARGERVAKEEEEEVGVEGALMDFVDDDVRHARQRGFACAPSAPGA